MDHKCRCGVPTQNVVTRQCWVVSVELINIVVITNTMSIKVCMKQFAALEAFYATQLSAHIEDISEQNANWNRTGPLVKCCSPAGVLWCSPRWFWQWTQSLPQADSPRTGPWPRTRPRPITRTSYDYFRCGSWQSSMCSFMFKWETMFWLCGKRLCGTRKVKLQKHGSLTRFRMVHRLCSLTDLLDYIAWKFTAVWCETLCILVLLQHLLITVIVGVNLVTLKIFLCA